MTVVPAARGTIRVEAANRPDALDLAARLGAMHTNLVQLGDSHWLVCIRPQDGDDHFATVHRTACEWASERSLESVLSVGEETHALPRPA